MGHSAHLSTAPAAVRHRCDIVRRSVAAILHVAPPRHVAAAAPRYAPRHSALATRNSEREGGPAPPLHHEPRPARTAGQRGRRGLSGGCSISRRASGRLFSPAAPPGTTARTCARSSFVIRVITSPSCTRGDADAAVATITHQPTSPDLGRCRRPLARWILPAVHSRLSYCRWTLCDGRFAGREQSLTGRSKKRPGT